MIFTLYFAFFQNRYEFEIYEFFYSAESATSPAVAEAEVSSSINGQPLLCAPLLCPCEAASRLDRITQEEADKDMKEMEMLESKLSSLLSVLLGEKRMTGEGIYLGVEICLIFFKTPFHWKGQQISEIIKGLKSFHDISEQTLHKMDDTVYWTRVKVNPRV